VTYTESPNRQIKNLTKVSCYIMVSHKILLLYVRFLDQTREVLQLLSIHVGFRSEKRQSRTGVSSTSFVGRVDAASSALSYKSLGHAIYIHSLAHRGSSCLLRCSHEHITTCTSAQAFNVCVFTRACTCTMSEL
jgi:hypothetical protein